MKVLHILDLSLPSINGYSSRSDAIIRNLRLLGVETAQMTCQVYTNFSDSKEDVDGITYHRTNQSKGMFRNIPLLGYIDHVFHLAKRIEEVVSIEKPDVIHAHSPMLNGLAGLLVRKRTGIPLVYEVRAFWEDAAVDTGKTKEGSLRYLLIKNLEQFVFKHANKVACICEGLKNAIVDRGIPTDRLIVSPNAVDFRKFQHITETDKKLVEELKLSDKKVLGFLGSFFKYEGLEFAIKAMPKILQRIPNAHLLLVGGGNQDAELKALCKKLQLDKHITFTGRVPYQEITRYYSLVDILVFPRENIRLTQLVTPLKPLESMALGKPIIASDVGGHRELIEDGVTGVLFESENIELLAKAAISLLESPEKMKSCIDNGHNYVENVRNWKNTATCYLPVYEEVTNANRQD